MRPSSSVQHVLRDMVRYLYHSLPSTSAQPTKGWTRLHNFGKDWNEVNRHYEIVILDGMLPNLQVTTVSTSVDANSYAVVFFVRFVSF